MTPTLRPYQSTLVADIRNAWSSGARNVLAVLPTGGGKTVVMGDILSSHNAPSVLIAHRSELVSQSSLMLAKYGIRHSLIAADDTKRAIAALHIAETGQCFYTPGARCVVASVDTLVRAKNLDNWARQVTLWVVDESHHLVTGGNDPITGIKQGNKWHKAVQLFTHPLVHGLGPTATPRRADGKGLGIHHDGLMHTMVEGPSMRWLIDEGYLTDYKVYCPESDLRVLADVSASGDWSPQVLKEASDRSHIIGDVVKSYRTFANGLTNLTFTTDVETAMKMRQSYRDGGIIAECVTGNTDPNVRRNIFRAFERAEINVVVTVDIVGEGTDIPTCQSITEARPTQSEAVQKQHWGRGFRPLWTNGREPPTRHERRASIAASRKPYAVLIDHTGCIINPALGPPDKPCIWTLDRRDRKARTVSDAIPLRVCLGCYQPFERIHKQCPWCGEAVPPPAARSAPEQVEGDLAELSPDVLARLRGDAVLPDIETKRTEWRNMGLPEIPLRANVKRLAERHAAQAELIDAMAAWGGPYHAAGETDSMIQRRFWFTYNIDVLSALAQPTQQMRELAERLSPKETVNAQRSVALSA